MGACRSLRARRAARTAALVLTGTLLTSGALPVPSARAAGSDLLLDAGAQGSALFSSGALAPGRPVSRCVAVTASNASDSSAEVRLYAQVAGALAPGLLLRIELGSGGSYDDCSGFTGASVFSGTLADFGSQHPDLASGLAQATALATYRFTVELADDQRLQGLSATTQFVWEAQGEEPSTDAPPPPLTAGAAAPDNGPALPDAPSGPGTPAPAPGVTDATAAPGPSGAGAPGMPLQRPRTLSPEPEQGALARTATRVLEAVRNTALIAGQVAGTGARAAGMTAGLVALVALFLVTQDRIDRSDPRLELSPLHGPGMLEFSPADPA